MTRRISAPTSATRSPLFWPSSRARRDRVGSPASLGKVALGRSVLAQVLDNLLSGGLPEYQQVEQRVAPQAIGAVHRHAGALAHRVEPGHHGLGVAALRHHHLAVIIGRDAAHLVMAGRHHRDRVLDRVHVGELLGDLADAGQALADGFLAQVVELEQDAVAVLAGAAAFLDLGRHRARHDIAAREVLGVRRIALHEALAVLVEEVAALSAHALRDQHARARHAGRMELPELHVLERNSGARRHAQAVTGIDESVGAGGKDAPGAAGGENRRLRLQDHHLARLHLERA